MKMLQKFFSTLILVLPFTAHADSNYSGLVVFGDSLSDPGNVFALSGDVSVQPYNASNIPDAPYPVGGLNFSNGETWAERLSAALKLKGGTGPALRAPVYTNYAFGGARAASSAGGPFDMSAQVSQYLAGTGGTADSRALYVVFFGGNDVRDALVAFNTAFQVTLISGGTLPEALVAGQAAAETIITDAITTFTDNMIALGLSGAQNFLVPNVPNLGIAPVVTALGPDTATLGTQLTFAYNQALENALAGIELALPVNITRLDVFSLMSGISISPETFGLVNATDACLTPGVPGNAICNSPDDYLFWDGIHPTRVGHALLSNAAISALP